MKKISILLTALVLLLIVGCKDEPKLKIGYIPIADCSQVLVAKEKGFFDSQGLDVELKEFSGGPQILEALGGGHIDVGFSNLVSLAMSNEKGIDFRSISGGPVEEENHIENSILVLKNGKIKTAKDLAGKKIAINAKRNIIELMVKEYLRKYGVDINSVQFVEAKFSEMKNALLAGQVDAIAIIEPFVTKSLLDSKISKLSNYINEVSPRLEISSYNAKLEWINSKKGNLSNKELIKKFQNAMALSTKYSNEHPEDVKEVLAKYTKVEKDILDKVMLPNFVEKTSYENFQILIEKMKRDSLIKKEINAKDLIYND